jgi:hypothetical protein
MSLLADEMLKLWKKAFARSPKITAISSLVFVALGIAGIVFGDLQNKKLREEEERRRKENFSYNEQLQALNNVQGSLNSLIEFVEMQKTKLKESEDLIVSLRIEQEKLKPVVEADRKTVEALLSLQAERNERNIRQERWYGFGLGVVSSIVASFIFSVIVFLIKRKRNVPLTTE